MKTYFPSKVLQFLRAKRKSLENGNPRRRRQEWEQIVEPNCCAFNSIFILIETITISLLKEKRLAATFFVL
jgi:hypothetical protein